MAAAAAAAAAMARASSLVTIGDYATDLKYLLRYPSGSGRVTRISTHDDKDAYIYIEYGFGRLACHPDDLLIDQPTTLHQLRHNQRVVSNYYPKFHRLAAALRNRHDALQDRLDETLWLIEVVNPRRGGQRPLDLDDDSPYSYLRSSDTGMHVTIWQHSQLFDVNDELASGILTVSAMGFTTIQLPTGQRVAILQHYLTIDHPTLPRHWLHNVQTLTLLYEHISWSMARVVQERDALLQRMVQTDINIGIAERAAADAPRVAREAAAQAAFNRRVAERAVADASRAARLAARRGQD